MRQCTSCWAKQRADVMAPLPTGQRWAGEPDRLGFWLFDVAVVGIAGSFLWAIF